MERSLRDKASFFCAHKQSRKTFETTDIFGAYKSSLLISSVVALLVVLMAAVVALIIVSVIIVYCCL